MWEDFGGSAHTIGCTLNFLHYTKIIEARITAQ